MDYVFANFFAAFAALAFSVFTSFIATRSGRPIYRKIMWSYLAILLIAAIVITVMQLSTAILALGSLFTCILLVVAQFGVAATRGHISVSNAHRSSGWRGLDISQPQKRDYFADWFWRDNQNRINHRNWH